MGSKTFSISNNLLQVEIKKKGAELTSMISKSRNLELIWEGNPAVWDGQAPVLFPIIGCLKNGSFLHNNGHTYWTPKHGFIRKNENLEVCSHSENQITLGISSSAETRSIYPFDFRFEITYRLDNAALHVDHKVINPATEPLLFSLGGHPAFKVPLLDGDRYQDYKLVFEKNEDSIRWLIDEEGLIAGPGPQVFKQSNVIQLDHALFNEDALVFKDLKSRSVRLVTDNNAILQVDFHGFDYLGIWAKPNGDFVCIEPWIGIADPSDSNGVFAQKEGIVTLAPSESFKASYSITSLL